MVFVFAPIPAGAQAETYACADKAALTRLSYPLAHMALRIAAGHSVTIVALGSSSTAGAGASGPLTPDRARSKAREGTGHRPSAGRPRDTAPAAPDEPVGASKAETA